MSIFRCQCRYLAGSVDSGLDLNEISPDLVDFMLLFVEKSKISPNLVDCSGFQEALCLKTFGSHQILLILWSGRVARVFGEETYQATQRDRVLWVATHQRLSDWSVRVVADRFRAGPAGWAGHWVVWTLLIYFMKHVGSFGRLSNDICIFLKGNSNKCLWSTC